MKALPEYNPDYTYTIGIDFCDKPNRRDYLAYVVMRKNKDGELEVVLSNKERLDDAIEKRRKQVFDIVYKLKKHFKTKIILGI